MISNGRDSQTLMKPEKNGSHWALPAGAEFLHIGFTTQPTPEQKVWFKFPAGVGQTAVLLASDPAASVSPNELIVLTVPASEIRLTEHEEEAMMNQLRSWVDTKSQELEPASLMMTLQGARIFWKPGRVAIFAPADRLKSVCNAVVEASYYEAELTSVEQQLNESWPQLEADMPLAFEFQEKAIGRRKQLQKQFQQSLLIRGRLSRIAPHVHCPHVHPPTLASQVGERLRERTRMVHRHESLGEQLEVFERVYELCGDRASNYMLTRSGNILEWVIILLLLTQILFSGFEILTSYQETPATNQVTTEVQATTDAQRTDGQ